MDYCVDVSCDMKVNRSCALCRQKVTELMHCLVAVYSVDFTGADNSMKLKARGNPNAIMFIMDKYGEHGKITNLRLEGDLITSRSGGGFNSQSGGYYLPSNAAANYPYMTSSPYPYPYPPPPPQSYFAGNCAYPMSNQPPPQQKTEAPRGIYKQHTAPPDFTHPPPPPRPLYNYAYIEPPYWPTSSSDGGKCVIM
ncbi:uncharacterized protein LOC18025177 [Eutrema salsugineum]|uniref:uncharacterized protein LOC18025177 n=1 Tax=Eutrema salsugineum TaxID=72664 RepID=UPI000CED094D|nr:uncharacterized protein LOC18025177 [Eutrema salsugineum]